jgi:hypothetical protein
MSVQFLDTQVPGIISFSLRSRAEAAQSWASIQSRFNPDTSYVPSKQATLGLVAIEWGFHIYLHRSL